MKKFFFLAYFICFHLLFTIAQNTKENGYVKFYYPNKKVSSEGYMINGRPDGYWKTFYVTGVLKSEGNRKNFLLDSIWVFYNEVGDTLEKINYNLGKKNGYYFTYGAAKEPNSPLKNTVISKELYVNDKREGPSYYYYNDGHLKEIIHYRNNKKHGEALEFNKDSILIAIYQYYNDYLTEKLNLNRYKDGLPDGLWRDYYPNGRVKTDKVYHDGVIDGYEKVYNQDGSLLVTTLYDMGKVVNVKDQDSIDIEEKITKYPDGKIKSTGYFKKNIPVGIYREYNENGEVVFSQTYNQNGIPVSRGIITDEGIREGAWSYLYENGTVRSSGNYENNRQNGKWDFYYVDGVVEQIGNFSNGYLSGLWKWFSKDGKLLRIENYVKGRREGDYFEFSMKGDTLVKGEYSDGEKIGFWIEKSGDIIQEGNYANGLRDSIWKTYYANGNLMYEGNFIQGNPDGKQIFYYPDGKIREEQYYVSGIKEKIWKKYNPDGLILLSITYENDMETRINGIRIDKIKRN